MRSRPPRLLDDEFFQLGADDAVAGRLRHRFQDAHLQARYDRGFDLETELRQGEIAAGFHPHERPDGTRNEPETGGQ